MIHIFDVDYTVIRKPSTWYFLREALKKDIIKLSQVRRLPLEWLRYKLGRPNMDFIEDAVKHLAGIEREILEQAAQTCFEQSMKANIYTGAANIIRRAQQNNERVIFATSSILTFIQPLENFFGLESSIATMLEFSDNKTTGRITGQSCFGHKKKIAVEAWLKENNLSPASACFYSDSYTDIPLMEYCDRPIAVNPDRTLAKTAKKHGWEIVRFRETLGKF